MSKNKQGISRRDFLKSTGIASSAMLLASIPATALAQSPDQENIEIVYVVPESTTSSSKLFDPVVERFTAEHPNVSVRFVAADNSGGWGAYFDSLVVLLASGEPIDMGKIPSEGHRLAVARDLIVPFDPYMDVSDMSFYFDDVAPQLAEQVKFAGLTYGLPYDFNNMVIWLNTKALEEVGLDAPPEDWSFEDFLTYAQALTTKDGDNVSRYGFSFWTGPFGVCPWLFNNGIEGFMGGDALEIPLMNDPAFVEVYQMLYDFIYTHGVSPRTDSNVTATLESGTAGMTMAGRWPVVGYLDAEFEDYTIQYWPNNGARVTEVGTGAWPIFSASQNPDMAWQFELAALNQESVKHFVLAGANIPAYKSVAEDPDYLNTHPDPENARIFFDSINRDDIQVKTVSSPPEFNELDSIQARWTSLILADEISVEEGLASFQEEMEAVVASRPAEWADKF